MTRPATTAHANRAPEEPAHRKDRPAGSMQPPMTPMIDVTFQLLIFFLLTSTFRQAEGMLPGSLPKKDGGGIVKPEPPPVNRPVVVAIRPGPEGQVLYEMEGLATTLRTPAELYRRLAVQRQMLGEETDVLIHARGDVQWRWAVEAYNQALRAKFRNVSFRPSA